MEHDALRRALAAHLELYRDIGVEGWRTDAVWTARSGEAAAAGLPVALADESMASGGIASLQTLLTPQAIPTAETPAATNDDPAARLERLRVEVGPCCTRCKLHALGRKQVVFGVGSPRAELMFAGEAPGRDEDEQGEPFVGRAGQLLTKIIEAMGLTRGDVYIANVIKCRPPENRNPEPDEVATCQPFLFEQIDTIQPKVIVALGTFAAQSLLQTKDSISKLRGKVWHCRGARLVPTFHPAFLLRSPERKRDTWEDMKMVMKLLRPDEAE